MRPLSGGESVLGMRVAYTPGHASHHVCYLHEESGTAFVGDVAAVLIPGDRPDRPAHPAARHRHRGLGGLDRDRRGLAAGAPRPHPLGPGRGARAEHLPRCASGCARRRSSRAISTRTPTRSITATWSRSAVADPEAAAELLQACRPSTSGGASTATGASVSRHGRRGRGSAGRGGRRTRRPGSTSSGAACGGRRDAGSCRRPVHEAAAAEDGERLDRLVDERDRRRAPSCQRGIDRPCPGPER